MACRFVYSGKTYTQDELATVLRDMPPSVAHKYIHGVQNISDAPFVGDTSQWSSLALKRMIRYAAEHGYDQISWTPGSVQTERYDLSKQISELHYTHVVDQHG